MIVGLKSATSPPEGGAPAPTLHLLGPDPSEPKSSPPVGGCVVASAFQVDMDHSYLKSTPFPEVAPVGSFENAVDAFVQYIV